MIVLTCVIDDGRKRTKCVNKKRNATKNKCACNNRICNASNKRSKHDLLSNSDKCKWNKIDCANNKNRFECNNNSNSSKNKSECSNSSSNNSNSNKPNNVAAWRKNNACA